MRLSWVVLALVALSLANALFLFINCPPPAFFPFTLPFSLLH